MKRPTRTSCSRNGGTTARREHRDAILTALTVPHDDLATRKLDVLHPEPDRLHQPQPCAVQQTREQPVHAFHVR